jgi:hypothetical protein
MRSAAAKAKTLPLSPESLRCRKKFLRFFPKGFSDQKYWDWERGYKWSAHERWNELLSKNEFTRLVNEEKFDDIGQRALRTLSGTNLLFSFESMALRDALKTRLGSRTFANGLYDLIYGGGKLESRFERWCDAVASLPKKQSRVFTHPVTTVFGFIAQPTQHIFLKPLVTKRAAAAYGFDFEYTSRPGWTTYKSLLDFASLLKRDLADLKPKDMIDIQSFIWVQGSDEYS